MLSSWSFLYQLSGSLLSVLCRNKKHRLVWKLQILQLAIGKNLVLLGTSSYDTTSNCGVFVIVDGVKPYQKTIPIGQGVGKNYSKWKYTLTSAYTGTIKQGINRITAKLLCKADPVNLTKFYSINVTGTTEKVPQQHQMMIRNTNSTAVQTTPLINHLSFSTTSSASTDSSKRDHHHSTSLYSSSYASSSRSHHHGGHAARGGYVNCRVFIQSHGPCL